MLEKTRSLFDRNIDASKPIEELINILEASIEILSLPENDFTYSSWRDLGDAVREISGIVEKLQRGEIPEKLETNILFIATGPMQEVSISSGWGDSFLRLAGIYDEVEKLIWD